MPFDELRIHRARIKSIADEIDRFPTEGLVHKLCKEAVAGIRCDPKCAIGFFAVWEVATKLLVEGTGTTVNHLSAAVDALDTIVAVRMLQGYNCEENSFAA